MKASRCSVAILRFELVQREATPAEKSYLQGLGTLAEVDVHALDGAACRRLRPGAGRTEGRRRRLSALRRRCATSPALPTADLFAERDGVFGAAAPDILFERLGLKVGDRIKVGSASFELRAMLDNEPDAASDGFGFAPRLLVSLDALDATGLIQPGSLFSTAYKVRLAAPVSAQRAIRHARSRQCRIPRGGLERAHARQCRAGAVGQHRALLAIPDAWSA